MPYRLGIDLGTTFTAAAVCRRGTDGTVHNELVSLGTRASSVPSVLFLAEDTVLVGEAAERRALTDPQSVVREFKRRVGDEIPILVGDTAHEAHDLVARLVRWVVDRVVEREGEQPDAIAVTYPASWGPHRSALLRDALAAAGIEEVVLLTEPQAAAMQYASAERIECGSTIAVYDLGGGTFDAALVRKTDDGGFELLGSPEGLDRLGGIDFDDAIVEHVLGGLPDSDRVDPVPMARLRRECTEAKEALSADTEAIVPVLLPGVGTQVRITRASFEALIRPVLAETVESLSRAIAGASRRPDEVDAVLLVGGSSRIPLVGLLITESLGRPVAVDTDPKGVVALGAALAADRAMESEADVSVPLPRRPDHDCDPPELTRPRRRLRRTKIFLGTFIMLVLALAVIPSPFTSDTTTTKKDQTGPAQAGSTGTQANNPAQPGSTRKRNPQGQTGRSADGNSVENAVNAKERTSEAGTTPDGRPRTESPGVTGTSSGDGTSSPVTAAESASTEPRPDNSTPAGPPADPPADPPPADPPPADPPPADPPPADPPPSDPPVTPDPPPSNPVTETTTPPEPTP